MTQAAPTETQVENALHAWVVYATGLGASSVIWANQDGPRPDRPFAVLKIADVADVGKPWVNRSTTNAAKPNPNLVYAARTQKRFRFEVDVVTNSVTGETSARALLQLVRTRQALPYVQALLQAIPLGVSEFGPITVLDFIESRVQQLSRARLECTVYAPVELTETGYSIEDAPATLTLEP
jgi:hypothetical protein